MAETKEAKPKKFKVGQKVVIRNCSAEWINGDWGVVSEINGNIYCVNPFGSREFTESELETFEEEFNINEEELAQGDELK